MTVAQTEDAPVSITVQIEDVQDFGKKKSDEAFDLTLPAVQGNLNAYGGFHNPAGAPAEEILNHKPVRIVADGIELLNGRAFLKSASHTDKPENIVANCYGGNGDWVIQLDGVTLHDCVLNATHLFKPDVMEASWGYNGTVETQDYVYAPTRNRRPFESDGEISNHNVTLFDLQPSLFVYWLLYRAFKRVGYKLRSGFFDTPFFRRQVMPWVWGRFVYIDDERAAPYKFRALCTRAEQVQSLGANWLEWVSPVNSSALTPPLSKKLAWEDDTTGGTLGGFDSSNLYEFLENRAMRYKYPANSPLGLVTMTFELSTFIYHYSQYNTSFKLRAYWFITPAGQTPSTNPTIGTQAAVDLIFQKNGSGDTNEVKTITRDLTINPGDTVTLIMQVEATTASSSNNWRIGQPAGGTFPVSYFRNTKIRKAVGSPVNFKDYAGLKEYKILDLLRGLIDLYNLQIGTDPVSREVFIEPTHDYILPDGITRPGYFTKELLNWTDKQDLSKESVITLEGEGKRELLFKMAEDSNDGGAAVLAKRTKAVLGGGKYIFPARFAEGIEERENRFFTPVVHSQMPNWKLIADGVATQLVTLIPENISNTSKAEDESKFKPKLAYYKGLVSGVGGWRWKPTEGGAVQEKAQLPFMFAVNYNAGGQNDPVLSYGGQSIAGKLVPGLLERFFLQRLATMRTGRTYKTWMRLTTKDATNRLLREGVAVGQIGYECLNIKEFRPLIEDSTEVTLRQITLPTSNDLAALRPSAGVIAGGVVPGTTDMAYTQLLILEADIPKIGG